MRRLWYRSIKKFGFKLGLIFWKISKLNNKVINNLSKNKKVVKKVDIKIIYYVN